MILVVTLLFSLLGFMSPANRGGLLSSLLFFWVSSCCVTGYVSAKMYVGLGGQHLKLVMLGACFGYSAPVFGIFFVLNLVLWAAGSSARVSFFQLLFLLILWFGVSVPLSILGSYFGSKRKPYEFPVRFSPTDSPRAGMQSN